MLQVMKQALGAFASWRAKRRAIEELTAMSDEQLDDLGIDRSEIEDFVSGRIRIAPPSRARLRLVVSNGPARPAKAACCEPPSRAA